MLTKPKVTKNLLVKFRVYSKEVVHRSFTRGNFFCTRICPKCTVYKCTRMVVVHTSRAGAREVQGGSEMDRQTDTLESLVY